MPGISISNIERELRAEGLNYGLPFTRVTLGGPVEPEPVEDVVQMILESTPKRGWVLLVGELPDDPLNLGIGTLVRGLSQLQRFVEVETSGLYRDPSWLPACDRWTVECQPKMGFNLGALRVTDCIRLTLPSIADLDKVESFLLVLKQYSCTKYVLLPRSTGGKDFDDNWREFWSSSFNLVSKFERTRLFVV